VIGTTDGLEDLARRIESLEEELLQLRLQLSRRRRAAFDADGEELTAFSCFVGSSMVLLVHCEVERIVPAAQLMPLPQAPVWVPGLLDLRGDLLPVVDILARAQGCAREMEIDDRIVVVRARAKRAGLLVQEVRGPARLAVRSIEPPPEDVPYAHYVLGVGAVEGERALVVGADLLLGGSAVPGDRW
jgi:chemotaxis signal transduction protein